ncbi:MAG: glycosyltransferase family 4 protein [Abitibacteriaceae bacterium]|nr:glycosyltransferase family 4 protein [Abditibacteriaceae bacterium]
MKICIITEYFYPDNAGGTPLVLSNLARYLKDHHPDLKIDVITSCNLYRGESEDLLRYEDWDGIKIFRLRTPKSNRPSTALRLAAGLVFTTAVFHKLMRRPRYDLLFIVTNPPTLPMGVQAYSRLRKTPYVYLIHDLYPDLATALHILDPASPIAKTFQHFQRAWLHTAAATVVIGRCMRDYLMRQYDLPATRIQVITNWCDPNEIKPLGKNTRFRKLHNLNGTIILYAGNFGQYQNFDNILEAAKQLRDRHPELTFVFVGEGARRDYIAERVAAEAITNVQLFSFVPQAEFADLLASADISLVTLEPGAEGLGVPSKFYNILASGRPTVAIVAADSEVARVLSEAQCGVTVPQNDPDELANTLANLASTPDRLNHMGRNARQVLEEKYTLQQIADQFYSTFETVALSTPKPKDIPSTTKPAN